METAQLVWAMLVLALPDPASSAPLTSSGFSAGCACVEECVEIKSGNPYCFVEKGKCEDEEFTGYRVTSHEACRGNTPTKCRGVSGSKCVFPFTFAGETFNQCTTHESVNGAAWCPTRLRSTDRKPVRGFLEDCMAPCNNASFPADNPSCPRNPVEEKSAGCCTVEDPCRQGEGGCRGDDECRGGLKCGDRNCGHFRWENYAKHNCCYDPFKQAALAEPSGSLKLFKLNEAGYVECQNNMDCPPAFANKEDWVFVTYQCGVKKDLQFTICIENKHDYCESPSRAANEPRCAGYDSDDTEIFSGKPIQQTGSLGGVGTLSIRRNRQRGCPPNQPCRDRSKRRRARCCRVYGGGYSSRLRMCPYTCDMAGYG